MKSPLMLLMEILTEAGFNQEDANNLIILAIKELEQLDNLLEE